MQFLGPAIGGLIVASAGTGAAFTIDAASLCFAAVMIVFVRGGGARAHDGSTSLLEDVREGVGYVRRTTWLWGTLLAFSVTVLVFWGPMEVLVPFVIKNDLGGGAGGYGLVLAAGGAGAIAAAIVTSLRGLPRRRLLLTFGAFIASAYATALYGVADAMWQMAVIAAVGGAGFSAALVAWSTVMQSRVPASLLGRVASLDWMVSISLLPVSFALVGPVSNVLGARATLIAAGVGAGTILLVTLLVVDDIRQPEVEADAVAVVR